MSTVIVQSTTIPNYQGGGSTAEIRIYATENFFSGGSEYVAGLGYFYTSVDCTVSGTDVLVPQFELESTTDSTNDQARYIAILYDHLGTKITTLFNGLEVGVPPFSPTTWQALTIGAQAVVRRMPETHYTAPQVDLLLDEIRDDMGAVLGAADLHLNGYATLASALAAAGSNAVDLPIKEALTVTSSVTIPDNVRVVISKGAIVTVASGQILTINSLVDPGNVKIFDGAGDVYLTKKTSNIYRTAWWTGPDEGVSIDTALAKIYASAALDANASQRILIPRGQWYTQGELVPADHCYHEGESDDPLYAGSRENTILTMTQAGAPIFHFHDVTRYAIGWKNLVIDGDFLANVTGVLCESTAGQACNLWFKGVEIRQCHDAYVVRKNAPSLHVVRSYWDEKCRVVYNTNTAMRFNSENNITIFKGLLGCGTGVGGVGILTEGTGAGQILIRGGEAGGSLVAGPGSGGTRQIIKQTVVAPSGITSSGTARCVVTNATMPGSPLTIDFAVTTTEHTSAILIARAAARALAQNTTIMELFNVGWPVSADFYLQTINPTANDPTFNVTIENVTCAGITNDLTSTIQVAGDAGISGISEHLYHLQAPVRQFHIYGQWVESVRNVFNIEIPDVGADLTNISVHGGYLGGNIRVAGGSGGHMTLDSVLLHVKSIQADTGARFSIKVDSKASYVDGGPYNSYGFEQRPSNVGMFTSKTGLVIDGANAEDFEAKTQQYNSRLKVIRSSTDGVYAEDPWLQILTPHNRGKHLRIAALNSAQQWVGYDIYRSRVDGLLWIEGNQGFPFNGIYVTGTSRFAQAAQFDTTAYVVGQISMHDSTYVPNLGGTLEPRSLKIGSTTTYIQNSNYGFAGILQNHDVTLSNNVFRYNFGNYTNLVFRGSPVGGVGIFGEYIQVTSAAGAGFSPGANSQAYGSYITLDMGGPNGFSTYAGAQFTGRIGSVNVGPVSDVYGARGVAAYGYASVVQRAAGLEGVIQAGNASGGTLVHGAAVRATSLQIVNNTTHFAGVHVGLYTGPFTGTITNSYGLWIDNTIDGFGTNRYAIKSDSVNKSVFAGNVEVPAVTYSSTTWATGGTAAASVPRRDEIISIIKDKMYAMTPQVGALEGVVDVVERVECTTSAQLIYTVPAGNIFVGTMTVSNPTGGAIANHQTITNIGGVNYINSAVDASIASKDIETSGGASVILPLPAGSTITLNAAASGLVGFLRGILIPTALNPRLKLLMVNPTNVQSTVYATAANKKLIEIIQPFNSVAIMGMIGNNASGVGSTTQTLSVRPTATGYTATSHDYRTRTVVDTAFTSWGAMPVLPPSHTMEIISSSASANQLFRALAWEVDV